MPDDKEPAVLSAPAVEGPAAADDASDAVGASTDATADGAEGADSPAGADGTKRAESARTSPSDSASAEAKAPAPAGNATATSAKAKAKAKAKDEPRASTRKPSLEKAVPDRPSPLRKKTSAPTFYVAGFWRRLGAGLVDLAIIIPVAYVLCWIAGSIAGVSLPQSRHRGLDFWLDLFLASDPALIGALGLTLAIGAIYAMVFQITTAATPGMKLLKTRIIDVYGDAPSTARSLARTGGYVAGVATLALGFLWIGFDSEKRGLHDWIAGTYVVKS